MGCGRVGFDDGDDMTHPTNWPSILDQLIYTLCSTFLHGLNIVHLPCWCTWSHKKLCGLLLLLMTMKKQWFGMATCMERDFDFHLDAKELVNLYQLYIEILNYIVCNYIPRV